MVIYKITNKINNKVYIGLTTQSNPKCRWYAHVHRSKSPKENSAIHKAINKYGKDNFTFDIIDGANSYSELKYKEIHHIYQNNSLSPNGYNIVIGECKLDLSKMKKESITGTNEEGCILTLNSIKDIYKLGGSPKLLSSMLSGKSLYGKYLGYFWEYDNKPTIKVSNRTKKRRTIIVTVKGTEREFISIKEASLFIGCLNGNLSRKLKYSNGECVFHGYPIKYGRDL